MEADRLVLGRLIEHLKFADEIAGWNAVFKPHWRALISGFSTGIPFSIVQTIFQDRYGAISTQRGKQPNISTPTTDSDEKDNNYNENEEDNYNHIDLDHDGMEQILRRLPLPSLMRAKNVCKLWNTTISATNFNVTNKTYHFVTQRNPHEVTFFCATLNQWFPIRYHSKLNLCAAADGLFLFFDSSFRDPVIINLLTKQQRLLPRPTRLINPMAVELIVLPTHFEIISLDVFSKVQHYDSRRDEWKDIPLPFQLFGFHRLCSRSTLNNGVVYFTNSFGRLLCCYDVARGQFVFKEIEGGLPLQMECRHHQINLHTSLPSLVASNGKLFLVGRLLKEQGKEIWGCLPFIEHGLVGICELVSTAENNESWSLISVTPRDLLEETVKSSHGTDFMVAAFSDKIWLTIKGSVNLLMLNLESLEWSVLPGYSGDDMVDCVPRRGFCAPFRISPSLALSANSPNPLNI